jgi:hypothetical protein
MQIAIRIPTSRVGFWTGCVYLELAFIEKSLTIHTICALYPFYPSNAPHHPAVQKEKYKEAVPS